MIDIKLKIGYFQIVQHEYKHSVFMYNEKSDILVTGKSQVKFMLTSFNTPVKCTKSYYNNFIDISCL